MQLVSVKDQAPFGETLEDLKSDMEYFKKAFNKPVVDYNDIPEDDADMTMYDRYKTQ